MKITTTVMNIHYGVSPSVSFFLIQLHLFLSYSWHPLSSPMKWILPVALLGAVVGVDGEQIDFDFESCIPPEGRFRFLFFFPENTGPRSIKEKDVWGERVGSEYPGGSGPRLTG